MDATAKQHASGGEHWFRQVYDAQFNWVYRTLRRLGGRERDLEDLAHDLFVIVYRKYDRYDPSRPLRPWLFGIAFRVVSDYRRRAGFRHEDVSDPATQPGVAPAGQEQALHQREARELVLAALDGMNLDQRAVFILHQLDGVSIPEIAAELGVSHNTLYSRLRLARQRFAAAIARLRPRGDV